MWIPLAELEEGETLQASAGPAIVLSVSLSRVSQPVYNIEVHGEHVYQVGELGVLVHNTCSSDRPGAWFEDLRAQAYGTEVVERGSHGGSGGVDLILTGNRWVEQKAWSPEVWERLKGSVRNENMLLRLYEQGRKYIRDNPNGHLLIEFAWEVPGEVAQILKRLKSEFGDRFDWIDRVIQ